MALQNRVTPEGDIVATAARGLFMGNRGGRIHHPETKTLSNRRWASRQWITCVLSFKNRQRMVMGPGYTELFFFDEAAALAAGHRPCFECRRQDALRYQKAFASGIGLSKRLCAPDMDRILHTQRLGDPLKAKGGDLPDGTFIRHLGSTALIIEGYARPWSWNGYGNPIGLDPNATYEVLTPAGSIAALKAGYRPLLHPSASA